MKGGSCGHPQVNVPSSLKPTLVSRLRVRRHDYCRDADRWLCGRSALQAASLHPPVHSHPSLRGQAQTAPAQADRGSDTGEIVGIAVGDGVVVLLPVLAVWLGIRHRKEFRYRRGTDCWSWSWRLWSRPGHNPAAAVPVPAVPATAVPGASHLSCAAARCCREGTARAPVRPYRSLERLPRPRKENCIFVATTSFFPLLLVHSTYVDHSCMRTPIPITLRFLYSIGNIAQMAHQGFAFGIAESKANFPP